MATSTCQEDKTEHWLTHLERTIEIAHHVAKHLQGIFLMGNIEHWCIILIYEHHHLLAALLVSGSYQFRQTIICSLCGGLVIPHFFSSAAKRFDR